MSIDRLLNSLRKVKTTGRGQWVACCPAHDDKSPSLSIREVEDGRILIHCFAGCSPLEVLGAVGMDFHDVMPESLGDHKPIKRQRFNPRTLAEVTAFNAQLVALMAQQIALGDRPTPADLEKLHEVANEITEATSYVLGS